MNSHRANKVRVICFPEGIWIGNIPDLTNDAIEEPERVCKHCMRCSATRDNGMCLFCDLTHDLLTA